MRNDTFETSFGELMDIANHDDDSELKEFLRNTFHDWCNKNNKAMFEAAVVMEFRAIKVTMKRGDSEEWSVRWEN